MASIALACSAQGVAQAQTAPVAAASAADAAPPATSQWYGWQILATDSAALAVGLAIAAASEDTGNRRFGNAVGSAWGLGMIGSLSVHAAHDDSAFALAGLGYRSLVPPFASVVGLGLGCLFSGIADRCASDGARWGFALGALGTSAIDIGLFSHERRQSEAGQWYGWQALTIDAAALGAGVIVTLRRDEPDRRKRYGGLAVLPYVVGFLISPWVHAFHGRWGTALGSLALRGLAPAVGVLAGLGGYCGASGGADGCTADGAVYGLLGGTLLVAAIDIGLMSHERSDVERAQRSAATVAPFVVPEHDGLRAGIAATF